MAGDAHIGPEHAHAQAAMEARARELAVRGGLVAGGGLPEQVAELPPTAAPAARPEPVPPASVPVLEEPDDDFGFIDRRWTSEGW